MGLPGGFAALAGCGGGARAAGPVTVCERWRWGGGGIARDTGSCGAGCAWSGGTAPADHLDVEVRMIIRRAKPVYASSLIKVARCHLAAAGAPLAPLAPGGRAPAPLREVLEARLTDPRKPRGIRHSLGSLVSVLVAGVACGYSSILAIAGPPAASDRDVRPPHGTPPTPAPRPHTPPPPPPPPPL